MICPNITCEDLPLLIEKFYGLKVRRSTQLKSYDDKNFFVEVEEEICNNPFISSVSASGYVFKVLNSQDSQYPDIVEGTALMMEFLKNEDFKVSTTVKTIDGNFFTISSFPLNNTKESDNPKHIIRLLHFIPGILIHDIDVTKDILYDLGIFVGKLTNSLKGFRNESIEKRKYLWQLSTVPQLSKYLFAIKEPSKIELLKTVLASWESIVLPLMPTLEKGIVHGDLNEQNILVQPDLADQSRYHISGLLDFGDVSHSCCVFELAIVITYMVMQVKHIDSCEVPGYLLAGYLTQRKLCEEEWNVLKECIAGRFAQSLVLGAHFFSLNPANTYLLTTAHSWNKLEELWSTPKEELISKWKDISSRK